MYFMFSLLTCQFYYRRDSILTKDSVMCFRNLQNASHHSPNLFTSCSEILQHYFGATLSQCTFAFSSIIKNFQPLANNSEKKNTVMSFCKLQNSCPTHKIVYELCVCVTTPTDTCVCVCVSVCLCLCLCLLVYMHVSCNC